MPLPTNPKPPIAAVVPCLASPQRRAAGPQEDCR